MYDPLFARYNRGSFTEPVAPPTGLASDPPLVCVEVAASWVPFIVGALQQLCQPTTWIYADQAALIDILGRVQDLLALIGTAGACMEAGSVSVTIPAGAATGLSVVTFPAAMTAAPIVVVSESTGLYIASADTITSAGFHAHITANVPVIADSIATFSWIARLPT